MKKFIKLIGFLVIAVVIGIILLRGIGPPTASSLQDIPEYTNSAYVVINNNIPELSKEDGDKEFEAYSAKDWLGRCGEAYANISEYTMPKEARSSITNVKPSGWHTVKFDFIDGKYLYNRCHLIGFQLAGENDNDRNLITGTRYLNTIGMLPFENKVAEYVKKTGNHVLYRVTPIYSGLNLVADGVHMEALSVEDDKIQFNVYCYNIQPKVTIDYLTGDAYVHS